MQEKSWVPGVLALLLFMAAAAIIGQPQGVVTISAVVPIEQPSAVERNQPLPRPAAPLAVDARRFAKLVEAASRAHGVETALVHAVILAESSYDPNAVSVAGASGLMQLMPETARRHGVRDIFDPADNIRGGVKHLKQLLSLFEGDVELAVAAYNAGENAVIRAGNRIPPYPQTRAYVPKVIGIYQRMRLRQE